MRLDIKNVGEAARLRPTCITCTLLQKSFCILATPPAAGSLQAARVQTLVGNASMYSADILPVYHMGPQPLTELLGQCQPEPQAACLPWLVLGHLGPLPATPSSHHHACGQSNQMSLILLSHWCMSPPTPPGLSLWHLLNCMVQHALYLCPTDCDPVHLGGLVPACGACAKGVTTVPNSISITCVPNSMA